MAANDIPTLEGQKREKTGSRYARRLRADARVPAVMYGHGQGNVALSLPIKAVTHLLHEGQQLATVELADPGGAVGGPCLIKDVQWDHLGRDIVHVDLTRVDLSEQVEVEVELVLTGEPAALETPGAVLDHPLQMLPITCRADSIPESVTHDVGELEIGTAVTVADLTLPEGVQAAAEPETVVCQITIVAELPEEDEPEVAEGDEPEVIGADGEAEGAEDGDGDGDAKGDE
jgi:large subunit ribosomal protein L25